MVSNAKIDVAVAGHEEAVQNGAGRVFHYGYVVPDMEKALSKWNRQGAEIVVGPAVDPIQNVKCCFLVYAGCVPIELVAPQPNGPNPLGSRLKKGGGLDHVCLFTENLEADVSKLRSEGGVVIVKPCYGAVFDRRLAFVVTQAGLVVELMTARALNPSIDPLAQYLSTENARRQQFSF
jgi:methylmalonyl-CoA/ethylmalonyl-CoA epimerase